MVNIQLNICCAANLASVFISFSNVIRFQLPSNVFKLPVVSFLRY